MGNRSHLLPDTDIPKLQTTFKQIAYVTRNKGKPRTNRPYKSLCLYCDCQKECLSQGAIGRHAVQLARRDFDCNSYEKQNLLLKNLIEITFGRQRNTYIYHIIGHDGNKHQICRDAFMKVFGISKKKLRAIIRKLKPCSSGLTGDLRGKHGNHVKLSEKFKIAVKDDALSFDPKPSHYTRKLSGKLYFELRLTLKSMYQDFIRKHNCMKGQYTSLLDAKSKSGAIISLSSYSKVIKIMNFGFRKPRVDTCNFCDEKVAKLKYAKHERNNIRNEINKHLEMADIAYGNSNFDMNITAKLPRIQPWDSPPDWEEPS